MKWKPPLLLCIDWSPPNCWVYWRRMQQERPIFSNEMLFNALLQCRFIFFKINRKITHTIRIFFKWIVNMLKALYNERNKRKQWSWNNSTLAKIMNESKLLWQSKVICEFYAECNRTKVVWKRQRQCTRCRVFTKVTNAVGAAIAFFPIVVRSLRTIHIMREIINVNTFIQANIHCTFAYLNTHRQTLSCLKSFFFHICLLIPLFSCCMGCSEMI